MRWGTLYGFASGGINCCVSHTPRLCLTPVLANRVHRGARVLLLCCIGPHGGLISQISYIRMVFMTTEATGPLSPIWMCSSSSARWPTRLAAPSWATHRGAPVRRRAVTGVGCPNWSRNISRCCERPTSWKVSATAESRATAIDRHVAHVFLDAHQHTKEHHNERCNHRTTPAPARSAAPTARAKPAPVRTARARVQPRRLIARPSSLFALAGTARLAEAPTAGTLPLKAGSPLSCTPSTASPAHARCVGFPAYPPRMRCRRRHK